jgi:phenylalanyl-tRNA synthetase beta chain
MKFPYSMLLDYVSTSLSATEVGDLLTMTGFELEGLEKVDDEWVLDIKVASNRGDGLSVFGLAREVLAKDPSAKATDLYRQASDRFSMPDTGDQGETGRLTSVRIETPECNRYACRLFHGVGAGEAPKWIQKRLEAADQRPISLLVDLTNYVMLELGQPLHAFDMDKLRGGCIVVRNAKAGEKLTTLNGVEHELRPEQMMICDAERPVGAPGIMGGLETEVTDSTQNMLLESAHFLNTTVRRTRNQLGLNTEASYRFERSVDPEGVVAALNRFAMLLAEVDGGSSLVKGVIDVYPGKSIPAPLTLRMSRVVRLLGMEVTAEQARTYLERLGMTVTGSGEPFTVQPPSWRPDVVREDDLVEDVGRVHGYDKIPERLVEGSTPQGGVHGVYARVDRIRDCALRCGFNQMMSHTMRDLHPLDEPGIERVAVRNPTSPEMAMLRCSLLPCLAEAARRNGGRDLHLFEFGRVFRGGDGTCEERRIALLSVGALEEGHWVKSESPQADFFSLKGVVEELLATARVTASFAPSTDPRLHPNRQAAISVGKHQVGVVGQIHPDVAEASDLAPQAVLAELDLEFLATVAEERFKMKSVSRNPAVRRDIAILISKEVAYATLQKATGDAGGEVLEKQWLFDVYEGKGIPEGSHSLAIALQFRKMGGNFTDEEANQVRDRVAAALVALGATMR